MAQKSQGTGTSNRGFASMDAAKQREIASKGGQSVPAAKRSFSQDRRLAAEAGRKGGQSSHGGGRKQGSETDQVGSSASPMATEREEHRESVRGEPEKVDSH
jgi:general stress protein YciG